MTCSEYKVAIGDLFEADRFEADGLIVRGWIVLVRGGMYLQVLTAGRLGAGFERFGSCLLE
jgi:hypothetical protein